MDWNKPRIAIRIGNGFAEQLWALSCFVTCCAFLLPDGNASEPLTMRIQIQWQTDAVSELGGQQISGESARSVAGSIELSRGRFTDWRNLSLDGRSSGSLWLEPNRTTITIRSRADDGRGGVELTATGDEETSIKFRLGNQAEVASEAESTFSYKISELNPQPKFVHLPRVGKFWVRRVAGDRLRVKLDQSSLFFSPRQSVKMTVSANGLPSPMSSDGPLNPSRLAASGTLELRYELRRARQGEVVWRSEDPIVTGGSGKWEPVSRILPMPDGEGAYDLRVTLVSPHRFQRDQIIEESVTQLVVISQTEPSLPADANWRELASIRLPDRTDSTWLKDHFPKWISDPRNQGGAGPWFSSPVVVTEHLGEAALSLPSAAWYAYRLPELKIGQPVLMKIRVPNQTAQHLQVSVLEPGTDGKYAPSSIDASLIVSAPIRERPLDWVEQSIVFWPKCARPLVLFTNRSQRNAILGPIKLLGGLDHLPNHLIQGAKATGVPANQRLAAMVLEKGFVLETFGATLGTDPAMGYPLTDWQTFLEVGTRMVEYVRWSGYGGVVATVLSEGATLYPTKLIASTARLDSGAYFASGQDPQQKDVLELWLRLFDRAGLKFIPALEFSTPLVELERQLQRLDPKVACGIEPRNERGEHLLDFQTPQRGQGMYYSALDDRVQKAILQVVDEVRGRSQDHPSFGGIAIYLGPRRYVQLPESQWTQDERTLRRFLQQVKPTLVAENSLTDRQEMVPWTNDLGRGQFLRWRSEQWSQFIGRLATSEKSPPLYLLAGDYLQSRTDVLEPENEFGLDWEALASYPNVIPCRFHRTRPLASLAQQMEDADVDAYREFDQRLNALNLAGAYITTPLEVHTFAASETGPLPVEIGPRFLTTHGSSIDEYATLSLARSLMNGDRPVLFRGSWLLQRGNEPHLREWLASYRSLPSVRFENAASLKLKRERCLAAVRYIRDSAALIAYAVNASPWSVQIEVAHRTSTSPDQQDSPPVCRWLGPTLQPLELEGGVMRATLTPGALVAWQIADPDAEITDWSATPLELEGLVAQLRQRMTHLNSQLVDGSSESNTLSPKNADFEDSSTTIADWEGTQHPSSRISLDKTTAVSGVQSVLLERKGEEEGARCWMMSAPIERPIPGRIVVSASLKCDPMNSPRLRFGIEGKYRGELFTRSTELDANQGLHRLGKDWAIFRLEFIDLPTTGLEQARVTFDLLTPGKLWIDQVQVAELRLNSKERQRMREQIYLATEALNQGDVSIAADLLGTHWARHMLGLSSSVAANPLGPTQPHAPAEAKTADRYRLWLPRLKR